MAKKQKSIKPKPIGKKQVDKQPDFYHKHKNTVWTIIVLVVLTIFFIVNNTRKIPEHGSYPPNYLPENSTHGTNQQ